MKLEVQYAVTAIKALKRMPRGDALAVTAKIDAWAADRKSGDVKRLKGSQMYRLRHGDYRAVFSVSSSAIEVHNIAHRRDIYR